MKQNLYDIFDHLEAEDTMLPSLKSQPINKHAVSERVMQQAGFHTVPRKKKPYRLFGIVAAAAVLVGGTITAAAVSGNMELFFTAVSNSGVTNTDVPAVGMAVPDAIAQMQSYYSCPDVVFTQTDTASVSLLGLYNDHHTLMFSVQLTLQDDTVLPEDACFLPYFTLTAADGTQKELSQGGYLSEPLQKCETSDNIYYATYYLTEEDFSGCTLQVTFSGIYTTEQGEQVQQQICALQDDWKAAYSTENMTIEEWKAIWKEKDFDSLTREAMKNDFSEQSPVLSGSWSAEIPIPESQTATIQSEADGMQVTLDALSVCVSKPSEAQRKAGTFSVLIYLKDGTILSDDDNADHQKIAYVHATEDGDSMIYCYAQPIAPENVEKVELCVQYYDDNWEEQTDCYRLYHFLDKRSGT